MIDDRMKRYGIYLVLGIFCCIAFTSNNAQSKLTDGLVLALSFEEGKGNAAADSSPAGNDAKVDGKADWVDGKHGKGINIDENTWLVAPYIPFNEKNFTVQFWINCKLHKGVVFSQYEKNAKNLSLHFRLGDKGKVDLGFYGNDLATKDGVVTSGAWHNLTFVMDVSKKTRKTYVNGEEKASDKPATLYAAKTGDTIIGGWNRVDKGVKKAYQKYIGKVDEVRVWSRVLSQDEITASIGKASLGTSTPVDSAGKITTIWGMLKSD